LAGIDGGVVSGVMPPPGSGSALTKMPHFCLRISSRRFAAMWEVCMSVAFRKAIVGAVIGVTLSCVTVKAQEGTNWLTFQGKLFVLDNPTSAACSSKNVNFGDIYDIKYRWTANPNNNPDAIEVASQRGSSVHISTQSPNFSLNGFSTTTVEWTNKYNFFGSISPSSTNLTILGGGGAVPININSGVARITGGINDFLGISGCNITSIHAALVVSPN
jgi:hypothetical protein